MLYVNDILIVGQDLKKIGSLKKASSLEQVICNEGYGSGKADLGNAHRPRQDKEVVVVVRREIYDKGALEI